MHYCAWTIYYNYNNLPNISKERLIFKVSLHRSLQQIHHLPWHLNLHSITTALQPHCRSLLTYSSKSFHLWHDCHKKNNLVMVHPGILKCIPMSNTLLIDHEKQVNTHESKHLSSQLALTCAVSVWSVLEKCQHTYKSECTCTQTVH